MGLVRVIDNLWKFRSVRNGGLSLQGQIVFTCSYATAWSESSENQPMISNDVRSKDREEMFQQVSTHENLALRHLWLYIEYCYF
jgi:prolipoprotein diacylglyceryltransferase